MLSFRALASGSSGNAFLLQTDKVKILFDAGLRLPALRRALAAEGVMWQELSAVLLSHEHTDHCLGARDLALKHRVRIMANEKVLQAAGLHDLGTASIVAVGRPHLVGDVEVTCFPVSHDAVCPVGFLVRVGTRTLVLATDLGEVNTDVIDAVRQADLVVLESNHDARMLREGRYPYHLQQRVSGPTGHLSNAQASAVLSQNVKGEDVEVWLAHLSKENNTQALALRTVRSGLAAAGLKGASVSVAARDRPSLRWTGTARARQLNLFPDHLLTEPAGA